MSALALQVPRLDPCNIRVYSRSVPGDSNLPQRIEAAGGVDAYEREYMNDGELVVMREKTRMDWRATGFAAAASIFVVAWSATHGLGLGLGLGVGVGLFLFSLLFAVLRVRVTTEHVEVQYGLIGPKIPLHAIESIEAVEHEWTGFLRWGVSPLGRGEWLYSIAGDEGRAVKIVWRNLEGRRQVHYVGSFEHQELAAAIKAARRSCLKPLSAASPGAAS